MSARLQERPDAPPWRAAWLQMRSELQGNARLRLGLALIAATLCLWGLLLLQDQAASWNEQADAAQAEIERLKPLQSATQWPERAEQARKHHEALRAMLWSAASQGLAEAALQDTLRAWAEKAGLPVRELSVSAAAAGEPAAAGQPVALRARLVVDMDRIGLMGLLAELARSPRVMAVDSMRLRPAAVPARAEIEVRVLYRPEERQP